jgi:ZIP family zinc transporter
MSRNTIKNNSGGTHMLPEILSTILLPFLGTSLGAACVFFLKGQMSRTLQRILTGFAAGVMVAASIWSLIIPAMDQSAHMDKLAFLPAFIGVWAGFLFLLLLDKLIPHLHLNSDCPEGKDCGLGKSTMMVFAVALHNLPEGMAVGVVIAGWLTGHESISAAAALALALGIALQNLPEGAIISMPLKSNGMKKSKAFGYGVLSGIIEPIGAIVTILLANRIVPLLPYLLSFAAGAMLYVVVEELIPEMSEGEHSNIGTIFFTVGFTLMMMLDVALS